MKKDDTTPLRGKVLRSKTKGWKYYSSLLFGLRAAELSRHTFGCLRALIGLRSRPFSHICSVFSISSTGLRLALHQMTGLDAPHLEWAIRSTHGFLEPPRTLF